MITPGTVAHVAVSVRGSKRGLPSLFCDVPCLAKGTSLLPRRVAQSDSRYVAPLAHKCVHGHSQGGARVGIPVL